MFYRLHFKFTSFGCLNKNLISQSFTFLQGLAHQESPTESKDCWITKMCVYGGAAKVELIWMRRQLPVSCWKSFSLFQFLWMLLCCVFFLISLPSLPSTAQSATMPQACTITVGRCNQLTSEGRVKQSLCAGQRLSNASAPWALTAQLCSFRCC